MLLSIHLQKVVYSPIRNFSFKIHCISILVRLFYDTVMGGSGLNGIVWFELTECYHQITIFWCLAFQIFIAEKVTLPDQITFLKYKGKSICLNTIFIRPTAPFFFRIVIIHCPVMRSGCRHYQSTVCPLATSCPLRSRPALNLKVRKGQKKSDGW